ncbi:DUF1810 domain-containing protein [Sphingomonas nostoxanthinifaciens]|uniref:DUF1810 domain-containing protein n=1 Tax=Sphingomonas nostoxanthinifaciens TaxID=2872652 RepID=UPI001CC213CF|nr:DUF1810 domain-containing protein [Sphingomonas nostoxanthinifaciens]UAK24137.1 DUF1810 domain-containing protein [Sphingomonas nostoxanthinifaciens]
MNDPFDLDRFVAAQADSYTAAIGEIRAGAKRSHWMWFVFPQLAGLGHSAMAQRYSIGSLDEARGYVAHPLLGARYRECVAALAALPDPDAERGFGPVDAQKLRSSLTLFAAAVDDPAIPAALGRWFGIADPATLRLIEANRQC